MRARHRQGERAASQTLARGGAGSSKPPRDQRLPLAAVNITVPSLVGAQSPKLGRSQMPADTASRIQRVVSPEVPEPPAGTWSNCLLVNGVAYLAGMTARGSEGDEYAQAKTIFTKIRRLVEASGGNMTDIV